MNGVRIDSERFIQDLYDLFLARSADEDALKHLRDAMFLGAITPGEIVRQILQSEEFSNRAGFFMRSLALAGERSLYNDCTQYGELHLLLRAWINGRRGGNYLVDVGARGKERSNSYDLLRYFGWRGLLIEANPYLLNTIRNEFQGLDVEIAHCAISDYNGRAQLTLGSNDDVSSLEPWSAESWGATRGKVDVTVRRLPDLLRSYDAPRDIDMISIDIEGEDVKVLNDLVDDGEFIPAWILIEASYDYATSTLDDLPAIEPVRSCYEIAGQTRANLLLRRR